MAFPFVLSPWQYGHYRLGPTRLKEGAPAPRSAPMMPFSTRRYGLFSSHNTVIAYQLAFALCR